MTERPRILVVALGGTIAMTGDARVAPRLSADELIAAVPAIAGVADVEARSLRTVPGAHLSFADVGALARLIADAPADGIVVTQGTDTLEETAFLLDLLIAGDRPVVMTAAMRNPTLPGADGPANLLAAVRVAAAPAAAGLGVLVVMGDEIHAACMVRKAHAQSPAAFVSEPGPLGWVAEDRVRILTLPVRRVAVPASTEGEARVGLVTVALDDDGELLRSARHDGLVVETLGGGHVPASLVADLERTAGRMPVVLTSRTGGGELLRGTYDFAGSETDLLARGAISGGWLDGPKARVLLTVLLRAGLAPDAVRDAFEGFLAPPVPAPARESGHVAEVLAP